jgi:hypothetical protein
VIFRILDTHRIPTLLAATNSVNSALGGMFMPMVSASPAGQVQLVQ